MYPHDIPDTAHPKGTEWVFDNTPCPDGEANSSQELITLDVEPLEMSPTWIRSEALHAAVATAQMEVTGKGVVWGSEEILDLARVYGEFIRGER